MINYHPVIQTIFIGELAVDVLRLDLVHPVVSGNKWFKLKYNLQRAQELGHNTLLTFGGAFSNHIAATAAACQLAGMRSIGIIRGEETLPLNPTLLKAREDGMQLYFTDRERYRQKDTATFQEELLQRFGPHYLIPEGGNNPEGMRGCAEILTGEMDHGYVLCACGTGATFAGILASASPAQHVIGISVLKGENKLPAAVLQSHSAGSKTLCGNEALESETIEASCIVNTYCFNGYARFNPELLAFKNYFEKKYHIPLDHVYTAKLVYALFDLAEKKKFRRDARILVIHSGGLQGDKGFEMLNRLSSS